MAACTISREAKIPRGGADSVRAMTLDAVDPRAAAMFGEMAAGLERRESRLVAGAAHRQYIVARGLSDETARMSARFIRG